jgi:hypothetical protein
MDALGIPGLRQIHAAELAGADQADPQGSLVLVPFPQQGMKIHL